MLGEGIVSFGTADVTVPCKKRNASAKIVCESPTLPVTCSAAAWNSRSPCSLWKRTVTLSSAVCTPSSS
jgi:hypothetical protein